LTSTPILAYPLPDIPFILDTDASDKAVGAVLSQVQDSHERVIAYMSKSMNIHAFICPFKFAILFTNFV
jgi:hypothetical protein